MIFFKNKKFIFLLLAIFIILIFIPNKSYATYEITDFYFDLYDITVTLPNSIVLDTDNYNYFIFLNYDFYKGSSEFSIYMYYTYLTNKFVVSPYDYDSYRPYQIGAYNTLGTQANIAHDWYYYSFDESTYNLTQTRHNIYDFSSISFPIYDFANSDPLTFYVSSSFYENRNAVLLYSSQDAFYDTDDNLVFQGGPLTPVGLITARHLNQAITKTEIATVLKTIIPIAIMVFSALLLIFIIRYVIYLHL